jgi:3-hydroxyacyl-CoA dehydrogenase/enoyl-CoA hydratase/carnithine racemase
MSRPSVIILSYPEPDVAVLTFDDPNRSVNLLSRAVLDELEARIEELAGQADLAGLVVRSGKRGSFLAGADLAQFAATEEITREAAMEMCARGRRILARLSTLPFVTVAAIEGACLGGGAELALWCDRRIIATDGGSAMGFPEVQLGLIPGWGGTARTSRIVGLAAAIELITLGESVDGLAAAAMGLVSEAVENDPGRSLLEAAVARVRGEARSGHFRDDRARWRRPLDLDDRALGALAGSASARILETTAGRNPAPTVALEVMLAGARRELDEACQCEAEAMAGLLGTPVNRALMNVFFLTNRHKKETRPGTLAGKPRAVKSVGIIGAGIMGTSIAVLHVKRGIPVKITDAAPEALAAGTRRILEEAAYDKARGGADPKRLRELSPLVQPVATDAELADCDLVLEAVVENPRVKKRIFARLESCLSEHATLATNTSSIPIEDLAEGLQHAERFCGIHFFHPVRKMPLVEVIRGPRTSPDTIATAVAYARRLGKSPIVVNDGPGFLVNRLLLPYLNEALELVLDGVAIPAVERAATNFGMPVGPLTVYDMIGLDTSLYAGRVMWEAFPDRIAPSPLLLAMVKAGRLGQKSGAGFFSYEDKNEQWGRMDPALEEFIRPLVRRPGSLAEEQITARLLLPMVLEATRVLEERKVPDPRDVDLGLILGLGFPAFKGGLLYWADRLGAGKILQLLEPLADLGPRVRPTGMLLALAREGRGFYGRHA